MGRRKVNKEEGEHDVNVSVTIAKASETEYDMLNNNQKKKGKVIEAPKAQNYFHCVYKLLPDDKENVKTDIVTYGFAAKLYTESDSRVLRTWVDGEKTWVAWTNTHKVRVTKDVLLKMFQHSLELKIWDSKEKVSPRARFDRPKAFKLPQTRGNEEFDIENVKKLLQKHGISNKEANRISRTLNQEQHHELVGSLSENKHIEQNVKSKQKTAAPNFLNEVNPRSDSKVTQRTAETHRNISGGDKEGTLGNTSGQPDAGPNTPSTDGGNKIKVKVYLNENKEPQMGNLMRLAANGIKETDEDDENEDMDLMVTRQTASMAGKRTSSTGRSSKSKSAAMDKKAEARAAYIKSHGIASVAVKLSAFFTGSTFISSRLESPVGTVEDLIITLSLDGPLLSEPQRKVLNPMVIRMLSANNMPSKPLSYSQLQARCIPSYISYKFHDQPVHQSRGCVHASRMAIDDEHVVLLGIQDKEKLFEYLRGPGLEVEVHDRDRDLTQKRDAPTIFGDHEDDLMINKANLVTGRRTEHNAFVGKDKVWDPYGISKINLSDFLLGEKIVELSVPIRCCKIPDVIHGRGSGNNSEKIVGKPGNVDGPEHVPMPAANYIEAGSELKVKIEIAFPLKTIEDIQMKRTLDSKECPFSRLVYIFDYENRDFLQKIQNEVMEINAETLQLKEFPKHVIEAALSTYKLTESQRSSKTLNIITGFQIIDGKYHIFVLEGLRDYGIKMLWGNLPHSGAGGSKFIALYNSDVTFQERIYASLDVDLTRVRLHQPLDAIVKLPLLYVRDMVPRSCFEGVLRLHDLLKCERLRDAVRNNLFPTDEMIASLSKEFGIPLTAQDLQEFSSATAPDLDEDIPYSVDEGDLNMADSKTFKTSRPWTPLQLNNDLYDEMLRKRELEGNKKNFLADNISRVQQLEPIRREQTITCDPSTLPNKEAHNYSIQSLNTTELAKRRLRTFLSEESECRYTYSKDFGSATVLPVDPDDVRKQEATASKKEWQTQQGFVFPGRKTSKESNRHPSEPDFARLDELKKPWRENILHANKLKPTVDRMKFSWEERKKDFDIWTKPREFFGKPSPATIHLAGDTLAKEQRGAADEEHKIWEKSLVVEDTLVKTHRCATQTELLSKGLKSSSQLAKLQDVLKNEPRKHALSAPGLRLQKVPALSVVLNPTVDASLTFYERLKFSAEDSAVEERHSGYHPGPLDGRSWLLEKNKVPAIDYDHTFFEGRKGADFRLSQPKKEFVYKRPIRSLSKEERKIFQNQSAETV